MPDHPVVLITGANRGLGLEFVKQLHQRGDTIIAGYRESKRSSELLALAETNDNVLPFVLDVADEAAIKKLRTTIRRRFGRLDMLINNAGINFRYATPIDKVTAEDMLEHYRVNVVGPFLTATILRPLLALGTQARIVNLTSTLGSIERSDGGATPYRISKAGVNMLSKNQALEYKGDGIIVVALSPGWVRTDMGGPNAPLSPTESVNGMLKVIDGLKTADSGKFVNYDGQTNPY